MVVPIGGLAIDQVLGPSIFSKVIGKEFKKELPGKAFVIPIPHPSGASPWPYLPGNREKLEKAFRLIRQPGFANKSFIPGSQAIERSPAVSFKSIG